MRWSSHRPLFDAPREQELALNGNRYPLSRSMETATISATMDRALKTEFASLMADGNQSCRDLALSRMTNETTATF